jgi:hypothetical protein
MMIAYRLEAPGSVGGKTLRVTSKLPPTSFGNIFVSTSRPLIVFLICCVKHLPHDLQRQCTATLARHLLPASYLELRRCAVTVEISLMDKHPDADLDATRIPFTHSWLQRQEHFLTAFAVELAKLDRLGVRQARHAALERSVNGLHRNVVIFSKRRMFWNGHHRLLWSTRDPPDVICNRLVTHPEPLQM